MRRSAVSSGWNAAARMFFSRTAPRRRPRHGPTRRASTRRPGHRLDARGSDEHRGSGPRVARKAGVEGRGVELGLEGGQLAAIAVAPHRHPEHAEGPLVGPAVEDFFGQQHEPRTGAEDRQPGAQVLGQGLGEARGVEEQREGRRFAAGQHQATKCVEFDRAADGDGSTPSSARRRDASRSRPGGRGPDGHRSWPPGGRLPAALSQALGEGAISSPRIASPRPVETLATKAASVKWVWPRRWPGPARGILALEDARADEDGLGPSWSTRDASAGVAMPPAQNNGTGSSPVSRSPGRARWGRRGLRPAVELAESACVIFLMSPLIERRWRTASTMLPVPPRLGADHGGTFGYPAQRLTRLVAPQTNGTSKAHLSMWWASSAG